MKKKYNIYLIGIVMLFIIILFTEQKFKKKVYYNLNFFINFLNGIVVNDINLLIDNLGIISASKKISKYTKNQSCFFSLPDEAFIQILLKKNPCLRRGFSNELLQSKELQLEAVDDLKLSRPNLILFDIDKPKNDFAYGLKVNHNVRQTQYSKEILEYIILHYYPFLEYNKFYFWARREKPSELIYVKPKKIIDLSYSTPENICNYFFSNTKNCFIIIKNKKGEIVDVVNGNLNIYLAGIIDIRKKAYFIGRIYKPFNMIDSINDLNLEIIKEQTVYIIK